MKHGLNMIFAAILAFVSGCGEQARGGYQGYAEGEYVLVSASAAGKLEKRFVRRGDEVVAGAPLFALEQENEKASRREAEERVRSADARYANLAAARRAALGRTGCHPEPRAHTPVRGRLGLLAARP